MAIVIVLHVFFAAGSLLLSFIFRFDFTLGEGIYPHLFYTSLPINVAVFLSFSAFFNLFQGIWRYVSVDDLKDIVKTSAVASLVFLCIIVFSGKFQGYPRSIYLMNFTFFIGLNGGTRFVIRMFRESFVPMSESARNVIIVGAGAAGNEIAKTLKSSKNKEYVPAGFIDRDPSKHGKRIQGIPILGDITSLRNHIKRLQVKEIFIAIPEASNKLVKDIIDASKIPNWDIKFKIAPSILDIMSGKYQLNQIRDVSINDLLGRPNIKLDDTHVRGQLAGKVVLVTGAGGSIGSEICLQVAAYSPSRVICIDASEEHSYTIDQTMKKIHPDIAINTIVMNILDERVLRLIFEQYHPDFVFHAAAYKHVHLMEWNPFACLRNNVMGTVTLANIAQECGVRQFVMISTDKAVNPRGIMGISKRLTERVVLEREKTSTLFNVVRFGNVLGSSGSVIPLFQSQIRDGGPVTVTSAETRRFFMAIPEAVQLVLQASTLNESNAIFLLEMGEPIKIVDLAKNLIELSGLKVGEDIEIKIIGMRPGEKIEEELLTVDENQVQTQYEKIRIQKNINNNPALVKQSIDRLSKAVDMCDMETSYSVIKTLIPEMTGPTLEAMKRNIFA
jgi:FlaA1/EpsC-like NDP-sugar epimerase